MPATSVVPRFDILPIAAAASARNSSDGPKVCAPLNPCVGCVRIAVKAESAPASAHASDDIRDANTPAIRAVSGAADAARNARPYLLRRRNTTRATTMTGPRKSIPEYAGVTASAPIWNDGRCDGIGYRKPAPAVVLIE